jgi:hypothetical protein
MVAAAVGVGTAVAGVAGSAMSSSASGKAANAQQQAAQDANELQRELYDRNTQNFQPYLDAGNSGLQALLYRMGLGGGAAGGSFKTADQLRQELLPQYSTSGTSGNPPDLNSLLGSAATRAYSSAQWGYDPQAKRWGYQVTYPGGGEAGNDYTNWVYADPQGATPSSVDEAGLQSAINARLAEQDKQRASQAGDPNFGFLLKRFSDTNWQADPGYQFRLDQGNKALQNMGAMTGNLNSGRAIKDAIGYNSGMGSQEYGNAYSRFNTDQTNIYNKLAALAGMGQSSASSLAGVSQNYGAQVGNNLAQGANANAAGIIGQSNAWNQGIGTAANALGGYAMGRGSGYSGGFQPAAGVPGLGSGQGYNGWW